MIIKLTDMAPLGGLTDEIALFYDQANNTFYNGKTVEKIDVKKYTLLTVSIILLYSILRQLSFSGILPLIIGLLLVYIGARWFISIQSRSLYDVEPYDFTNDELQGFLHR